MFRIASIHPLDIAVRLDSLNANGELMLPGATHSTLLHMPTIRDEAVRLNLPISSRNDNSNSIAYLSAQGYLGLYASKKYSIFGSQSFAAVRELVITCLSSVFPSLATALLTPPTTPPQVPLLQLPPAELQQHAPGYFIV